MSLLFLEREEEMRRAVSLLFFLEEEEDTRRAVSLFLLILKKVTKSDKRVHIVRK